MTNPKTDLELARFDAQNLHKKISANIAKSQAATWNDIKASQADAGILVGKMKIVAEAQADVAKANINTAMSKLDAAAKRGENKAIAAKEDLQDDIRRANAALLEGARTATQSLSQAVADFRTKLAKAIEPKTATEPKKVLA